jgi:hypothetical protein
VRSLTPWANVRVDVVGFTTGELFTLAVVYMNSVQVPLDVGLVRS